ncbi:MAG: hypothetical protein KDC83_01600 [Flavobacteriales bacterium]|nr:hypothetical protein [Flavobacteriales bacterium]
MKKKPFTVWKAFLFLLTCSVFVSRGNAQVMYLADSTVVVNALTMLVNDQNSLIYSGELAMGKNHLVYAKKMNYNKANKLISCKDCDYTYFNQQDTSLLNHVNFELDVNTLRAHLTFLKSGSTVELGDFGVLIQYQENWFYTASTGAGYMEPDYNGRVYRFGKNTMVTTQMVTDSVIVRSNGLSVDMKTHEIHADGVARVFLNKAIIFTDSNGLVYNSKGRFEKIENCLLIYDEISQLHLLKNAEVSINKSGTLEANGDYPYNHALLRKMVVKPSIFNGQYVITGMAKVKKKHGINIEGKGLFWGKTMTTSLRPGITFVGKIATENGISNFTEHVLPSRKIEFGR